MKRIFLYMVILLLSGAAFPAEPSAEEMDQLKQQVEDLNRNCRYLAELHSDLNIAATAVMDKSDVQLNYIQRTVIFADIARMVCEYQAQFLSLTPYIRSEVRADFFTLRVQSLDEAVFETNEARKVLKVYAAYIENDAVRKIISEAEGAVGATIEMYEKLAEMLKPFIGSSGSGQ